MIAEKPGKCEFCHNSFAGEKYLANHVRYKHPDQLSKSEPSQSSSSLQTSKNSNQATYQKDVEEEILESICHLTELEDHEPELAEIKTNNRRGANQRKSYTIDFKIKTLDLLDTMKELKTKKLWEKVAVRRGVSKSLVVKWSKDRVKIRSQLALNKTEKNNGAARPTPQRRQYFQNCAWMDSEINMQWVAKTLAPGIGNSPDEKVIFADNVTFQQER